jgi:uncharacterized membrane protein
VVVRQLQLYLGMLAAFLAMDGVWLGVLAKGFYRDRLGHLLAPEPNWAAAVLFYLLFVAAVQVFVVAPGLRAGSLRRMLPRAAFFGFITYATYDLTNLATARDWPLSVTVVDLIWGTVLCSAVGLVGYLLGRRLGLPVPTGAGPEQAP